MGRADARKKNDDKSSIFQVNMQFIFVLALRNFNCIRQFSQVSLFEISLASNILENLKSNYKIFYGHFMSLPCLISGMVMQTFLGVVAPPVNWVRCWAEQKRWTTCPWPSWKNAAGVDWTIINSLVLTIYHLHLLRSPVPLPCSGLRCLIMAIRSPKCLSAFWVWIVPTLILEPLLTLATLTLPASTPAT